MHRSIPEKDWKVFRELRTAALERFCTKILQEAQTEIARGGKSAHERYLGLYKLVHDRDDDVARAFNDFRRSTAMMQIGIMHSMGLFTAEELHRFGPETLQTVALFGGPIPGV